MRFGYVVKMTTFTLLPKKPGQHWQERCRPYVNTIIAVSLMDAHEIVEDINNGPMNVNQRSAEVCVRVPAPRGGNITIPLHIFHEFAQNVQEAFEELTKPEVQPTARMVRNGGDDAFRGNHDLEA